MSCQDPPTMTERMDTRIQFNQDQSCIVCVSECGIRIFNLTPFELIKILPTDVVGTVKLCGMLGRSNVLYIVGGGRFPKFPNNEVMIFDIAQEKFTTNLHFPSAVTAVCIKTDKIAVSTTRKVYMYSFPELNALWNVDVEDNSKGLLEISSSTPSSLLEEEILIYPGTSVGSLEVIFIPRDINDRTMSVTLDCHNSKLSCIALNQEGTLAATASVEDNLIRVWCIVTKMKLLELRSEDPALITSISFNKESKFLCSTNEKGAVYVFDIGKKCANIPGLLSSFMSMFCSGITQQFAQFKLSPECGGVCAFGIPNTVNIVAFNGYLHKFVYALERERNKSGGHVDTKYLWNEESRYLNFLDIESENPV